MRRDKGLRLILNDDRGMVPSLTIVNQTERSVVLHAVVPSRLATDHGTYDIGAALGGTPHTIEPGVPLVIRVVATDRPPAEPCRVDPPADAARPVDA